MSAKSPKCKRSPVRCMSLLLVFGMLFFNFSGCGNKENQSQVSSGKAKITIGFSMATLKEDRWLRDRDMFTATAKMQGINVIVTVANNDSKVQYQQVQDLISKKIDVLVIAPQDCNDAAACVQLAKKAGIPVVSYDRLVRNADVDVYVSFDNLKVGQLQAEELIKKVPKGGYLILNGPKSDNNSTMFNEGYMGLLKPYVDIGKIQIIGQEWVQDWLKEKAHSYVSAQINQNPSKIKAILAANDTLASGAIDALSEARLTKKVIVVGHDAEITACQRIVEGTQDMTVYKPIDQLVNKTVDVCKWLANKESIPYSTTIDNGNHKVPYLMIDVVAVTKSNIDDTVIKDGFQLKEDVYRNIK